jgi:ubiquinone biosynthesis protein
MSIFQTGRQIGRTLKNASRLRVIVGTFVRHGFYDVIERIRLGQFVLERFRAPGENDPYTRAERIRICFEELGPTFVKLGQLLASRPDLIPESYCKEFSKLHDQAQALPFEKIKQVLDEEFGDQLSQIFQNFDPNPLGSASIAQVHKAWLRSGQEVVIKVQRPGILQIINDDLNVLYFLAELMEKYLPESRLFNPLGVVDEFFKTLELETNFVVESNSLRRFAENFASDPQVIIPKVYPELVTEKVLVMDSLQGIPLTHPKALEQVGVVPEEIVRIGLHAYLKMVFIDGVFHGDLHAGNFFILPENKVGLIDFGIVGRLNMKTQTSIASMLIALSKEDYERLAYEYIELAPFSEHVDVDVFARDLRNLMAPFYGLTFKNVNPGKILMSSATVAAKHSLILPSELLLFFKSIMAVEGLGRLVMHDFDFLSFAQKFAQDLLSKTNPQEKWNQELQQIGRESRSLLRNLPRQMHFLLKKINSPHHSLKLSLQGLEEMRRSFESSMNLLFLGLLIAALILSGSLLMLTPLAVPSTLGLPTMSFIFFAFAGFLSLFATLNYFKK